MPRILNLLTPLALLLALTACESDRSRGPRSGGADGTGDAPMTATGELATANPPPMDAQANFFGSQIAIEAMLAKSDVAWKNAEPADADHANGGRGGNGGGGFSGGMGGGGGRHGGGRGMGGGGRGGGGSGESSPAASAASADAPRGPPIRPENAPPVQLRLRLTNHGEQPADIEILDFNSDLGNFVVQPEKIALVAGATIETDPMTSRLGVPAVEEIPLTVRIRLGGKFGKMETQVLKLKPRVEAEAAR